jgi:hypothetical protein
VTIGPSAGHGRGTTVQAVAPAGQGDASAALNLQMLFLQVSA